MIYLGPVGNLQSLPYMGRGIGAGLDLGAAVQRSLSGARTVDYVGNAKRIYSLERKYLTLDELSVLETLALGGMGSGPHALLDPWRRNLLTANQSAGTDPLGDTTGFSVSSGTITSSTASAYAGSRSLAWAVTAISQRMSTGSIAGTTTASVVDDIPVVPAQSYVAQVQAKLLGSTGSLRLEVRWYDATGGFLSVAAVGATSVLSTSVWTQVAINAVTAPAGAALARLSAVNVAFGAATTIYLDAWQFEQSSVANAWVLGTGVPRVAFTSLGASYPMYPSIDASIELQEVG